MTTTTTGAATVTMLLLQQMQQPLFYHYFIVAKPYCNSKATIFKFKKVIVNANFIQFEILHPFTIQGWFIELTQKLHTIG